MLLIPFYTFCIFFTINGQYIPLRIPYIKCIGNGIIVIYLFIGSVAAGVIAIINNGGAAIGFYNAVDLAIYRPANFIQLFGCITDKVADAVVAIVVG